jgi:hypothetical protein
VGGTIHSAPFIRFIRVAPFIRVKQIGRRVKGSENFWSASGGDELLALRGDFISDGKRLDKFLQQFAGPTDGTRAYATAA